MGFDTPSGKVELAASRFALLGYDPLPAYTEPPESPVSSPELLAEYPLILITGSRQIEYMTSEGRQVPELRAQNPDPEIEIHPLTAASLGIAGGDWVGLETPRKPGERVRLKAKLTDGIDPRVVSAAYGWWFPERPGPEHGCFDSNVNVVLTMDPPWEEICGSVPLRGTLCRVIPNNELTRSRCQTSLRRYGLYERFRLCGARERRRGPGSCWDSTAQRPSSWPGAPTSWCG